MFLFLKLCLAHLIADFVLQFEELYRLKIRHVAGQVWHVVIHAVVALLLLWPYLKFPEIWFFVLGITLVHFLQDLTKYKMRDRYPHLDFVIFMTDQAVHLMVLSAVFLLPISRSFPAELDPSSWSPYYAQNLWTLYLILFLLTTFSAGYVLNSLRKNYFKGSRPDHFITRGEMIHGLIERPIITGLFLFPPSWILLGLWGLAEIPRLWIRNLKNKTDLALSFLSAAALGLLFRLWI